MFVFNRTCGVKDPSWSEIHYFVKFLDVQLESCERSVFCKEEIDIVRRTMSGLKKFVIKFMIRMSRVCLVAGIDKFVLVFSLFCCRILQHLLFVVN